MNSTIEDIQTKQKLSKKLKNIFTLPLLATSRVSLVPATASGKNHQSPPGLFDDSGIQQSTIMKSSLRELFLRFLSAVLALLLSSGNLIRGKCEPRMGCQVDELTEYMDWFCLQNQFGNVSL